jgi:hypothetical protein
MSLHSMAFVSASPVLAGRSMVTALCSASATIAQTRAFAVTANLRHRARATASTRMMAGGGPPKRSTDCETPLKAFLFKLMGLGVVRLIVRNAAAISEFNTSWDGCFFASIPSGEYANLIKPAENLDMHLLLSEVGGAKFEEGVGRNAAKSPTYIIRLLGKDMETQVLSCFLLSEGVEQERIDCWAALKAEYGAGENSDLAAF